MSRERDRRKSGAIGIGGTPEAVKYVDRRGKYPTPLPGRSFRRLRDDAQDAPFTGGAPRASYSSYSSRPPQRFPSYEDESYPESDEDDDEAPAFQARFLEEDRQTYFVYDLQDGVEISVPKVRRNVEVYPPTKKSPLLGGALLKWSFIALLAALAGGAGGILLGACVGLLSIIRLLSFASRMKRWRSSAKEARKFPAIASSERIRLWAALWQSMLAIVLGALALALFTGRL